MTDQPRPPPGSPCSRCGKCCTNERFMGSLVASGEDVRRWRRQGRYDILRFVMVLGRPRDPWGDIWIDPRSQNERARCPFVRKIPGTAKYTCTIYDTRPQVCRDYEPWSGLENDVCEIVE